MGNYRYSKWTGEQDLSGFDADELMDKLGQELMSQGDLSKALQSLQCAGIPDNQSQQLAGLQELLKRLREMKKGHLEKYEPGSALIDEIGRQLEKIISAERERIQRNLEAAGQKAARGEGELSPEMQRQLLQSLKNMTARDLAELDKLAESLQDQISQAQSRLDSLSPEDRKALQSLLQSIINEETRCRLAELADNLEALYPGDELCQQYPFFKEGAISYAEALDLVEMLQKMNKLENQLENSRQNRSPDTVDEKLLRELLGDEAVEEMDRLRGITKVLEEAGYINLKGSKYELTPRGMRKIGQKALEDIFAQFRRDRIGGHNLNLKGTGGERIDETRPYEFGDEFHIHLQKTIMNALYRETAGLPVKLSTEDFEVHKTEGLTWSATVLMLDLSVSMPMRGNFETAKRVTIALDSLIRTQYPRDSLYIVGFSSYARQIKKEDLSYMNWDEFEPYTNMQHGLYLSRKLLTKDRCPNKQIILITDGEPTAHYEGGELFLHNNPRTLQLTLREVRNCTQKGIVINTFMLESSRFLSAFTTQMTRLNKGRLFFTDAENLGQYLLVDYIASKRRKIQA
ncbi:MAG: hypothetical protein Q8Q07_04460 [Dehalococcoidales bacterium]|nr:hypothetical protein [Dehalococcoidales bacterium]